MLNRKYVLLLLALVCSLMLVFMHAEAETQSGYCGIDGDNLEWTLNDAGVLTIRGTGDMQAGYSQDQPWGNAPVAVIIQNGVTSIGREAFFNVKS